MTKAKFLMMSVAFALVYITCDMFFIFYIADKTDQTVSQPAERSGYSVKRSHMASSQIAFASQPVNTYSLQSETGKTTITE